jgi:glutathione S-transferase
MLDTGLELEGSAMALVVYGSTLSPFVRKVCVVLAEKGLPYEILAVAPGNAPADFPLVSPLKKMPGFRDTSLPEPNHLADSSVICDYIEHKYPQPPLYPSDLYQRARALWFEEYADSVVATCVGRNLFFERTVKKLLGQKTDESVCERTVTVDLPPLYDYLEKELGANEYFVGGAFSIADISVASMIVNYMHVGEALDAGRWPKLEAFARRILSRPSFKTLIDRETPIVKRMLAA